MKLILGAVLLTSATVCTAQTQVRRDWASRGNYIAENAALIGRPSVVFFGDSITAKWIVLDRNFFLPEWINRGVSGQTSAQMLVRFRQDVVNLHPKTVHIMAGTNDVAGNTGAGTSEDTLNNIKSMIDIATANGIRVVLSSILPSTRFSWKPAVTDGAPRIAALNNALKTYAAQKHIAYVDYWSIMRDAKDGLTAALTSDGTHPNRAGYAVMEPLARRALASQK